MPPGNFKESHLQPGTVIDDRYSIEGLLGEGGFGVVYLARQLTTGQQVAVKVLHANKLAGTDGVELEIARFTREMELVARLKHPNIVRLFDSGQLGAMQLYQVLEYVEGKELADIIREEGALPPAEARDLMFQVLDALSAAHQLGIVHRDMKPQNIMVAGSGFRRNAMVLDFGIAGIASDARDQDYKTLTMEGRIHGTPQYMAPEQLKGDRTSPSIDIYAWGLVFIEVLTGRKIMTRDSFAEIIAAVISPEPLPIPAELLQHPLGQFLARCTQKNPAHRFQSAHQALQILQDLEIRRNERFSWTGTSASDQVMASGSMSGPIPQPSQQNLVHSQQTMAYNSGSVSAPMMPQAEPRRSPAVIIAVILGLLVVAGGIVAWQLLGSSDTETSEAEASPASSNEVHPGNLEESNQTPEEPGRSEQTDEPKWSDGQAWTPESKDPATMVYFSGGALTPGGNEATVQRLLAHCREVMGKYSELCETKLFEIEEADGPVKVAPFLLDETEVTQGQWNRCEEDGACPPLDWWQCHALTSEGPFGPHGLEGDALDALIGALSGEDRPAVCATRAEAGTYCDWATKRLPTSVEFEWAATSGGQALYPWGDDSEEGGRKANGADPTLMSSMGWKGSAPIVTRKRARDTDGHAFLAPVKSFPQGTDQQGVFDLAGNVKEWVAGDTPGDDPTAIARGGSWAEPGPWLSGRTRSLFPPDTRRTDLGFRCAADPPETP